MADTRKEQERAELHRAIWAIADDLRGAVDGWDFRTMFWVLCSTAISPKTLPHILTLAKSKLVTIPLTMQKCPMPMQKKPVLV